MTKKRFAVLLAVCMLLLAACAGKALSEPVLPAEPEKAVSPILPQPEADYQEPDYEVIPFTTGNQAQAENGMVLAVYNYQTIRLALRNEDAVSPADANAAERNITAFNEKMESITSELMKQGEDMAADAEEVYKSFGTQVMEYEDAAETSAVFMGDIVSVCLRRYSYTGGAHPNHYVLGWLFDLKSGQFILDPSQLADDPQTFHNRAADLLIEKADSDLPGSYPGGYWEDYQDILRDGQSGVTLFDEEGMTVLYAPYELGPYAIGEISLHLDWEELGPLLGQGGLARLGRTE